MLELDAQGGELLGQGGHHVRADGLRRGDVRPAAHRELRLPQGRLEGQEEARLRQDVLCMKGTASVPFELPALFLLFRGSFQALHFNFLTSSSTSAACPSGLTGSHTLTTFPFPSRRKVTLAVPIDSFPMKLFSLQTPYLSWTEWSSSESSLTVSPYFSVNFTCDAQLSLLIPSTTAPAFSYPSRSFVKSTASIVQPGVSSLG